MTGFIGKKQESFIRKVRNTNPRNVDLTNLIMDDSDSDTIEVEPESMKTTLEMFKSLYGNELDLTEAVEKNCGRFINKETEVIWRAFNAALRQQKKAISRSLTKLRQKLEDRKENDVNYIIGMEINDGTVQFGYRPFKHTTLNGALNQADKLKNRYGKSYSVFKRVARVAEELGDANVPEIKQKEKGAIHYSANQVMTKLHEFATDYTSGDTPIGITIGIEGKYRVETVSNCVWFSYDTYTEALTHIANWIKGKKNV